MVVVVVVVNGGGAGGGGGGCGGGGGGGRGGRGGGRGGGCALVGESVELLNHSPLAHRPTNPPVHSNKPRALGTFCPGLSNPEVSLSNGSLIVIVLVTLLAVTLVLTLVAVTLLLRLVLLPVLRLLWLVLRLLWLLLVLVLVLVLLSLRLSMSRSKRQVRASWFERGAKYTQMTLTSRRGVAAKWRHPSAPTTTDGVRWRSVGGGLPSSPAKDCR